jgi:hypothetical protein
MVLYKTKRIVTYKGKKYRICGKAMIGNNGYAIADYRAVTKKKDYGWKPVKNYQIKRELFKRFMR